LDDIEFVEERVATQFLLSLKI